jgi:hypothetical protein
MMSNKLAISAAILAVLMYCSQSQAIPIVPGGFAGMEGDTNNTLPFSSLRPGGRYQQIYDAAAFDGISGTIKSIAFRLDDFIQDVPRDILFELQGEVVLRLGTTSKTSRTVSSDFEENIGSAQTVVFNGAFDFEARERAGRGRNPFDLVFVLEQTFFFDGVQNLLLDVTSLRLGSLLPIDASSTGPFGRVFSVMPGSEPTVSPPGFGAITLFDIEPGARVPEPSSIALLLVGLGILVAGATGRMTRQ